MASKVTTKSLYTQVISEIKNRVPFTDPSRFRGQASRQNSLPLSFSDRSASLSTVSTSDIINAMQSMLEETLPPTIISGLEVTATSPPSNNITITAGKGSVGATLYTLTSDTTVNVNLASNIDVHYVMLYREGIYIDAQPDSKKLVIAKIIEPTPVNSTRIIDTQDDTADAYIVQLKQQKLYGSGNILEEDSIDLLKANIGDILGESIVGNLKLSENLTISNTQGTLSINSDSLKFYNVDETLLALYDNQGVHFYNASGVELSRFTGDDARIGNILITPSTLQSTNFVTGSTGFQINDDGSSEFSDVTVRGNIDALTGTIGGFTIGSDKLYGTTTGTIQTGENVGAGQNGVKLDIDGLHVYDAILGRVVYLPSDGSAPEFSSGVIQNTTFEINTNAVLRTSDTVGDGSSSSAGILINNTGIYGCSANQSLANANLKALVDGTISLSGEITSTSGQIGSVSITPTKLSGGTIEGALLRGGVYETSATVPKITISNGGITYQLTSSIGTYGATGSGLSGFEYGDGTLYGAGSYASLFNPSYPAVSILAESSMADMRLYNRSNDPTTGTHEVGDLIVVNGKLKLCTSGGNPGTFTVVGDQTA